MLDEKYINDIKRMDVQQLNELKELINQKENELNVPIEAYNHQKFVLNFKRNHLICNWCRGLGKTYTIALLIYKNRPRRVIYTSQCRRDLSMLQNKFKEIQKQYILSDVERFISTKDKISIKYKDGSYTEIFSLSKNINKNRIYDYVFFDDKLSYALNIKAKHIMSFITINNKAHWLEQLFPQCVVDNQNYKTGMKYNLFYENAISEYKKTNIKAFKNEIDILS